MNEREPIHIIPPRLNKRHTYAGLLAWEALMMLTGISFVVLIGQLGIIPWFFLFAILKFRTNGETNLYGQLSKIIRYYGQCQHFSSKGA